MHENPYGGAFGYQSDGDLGLMLLGHRYYDASTGRFISRDPVGDGGNWYVYCGNNPLNKMDFIGLSGIGLTDGGLAIPVVGVEGGVIPVLPDSTIRSRILVKYTELIRIPVLDKPFYHAYIVVESVIDGKQWVFEGGAPSTHLADSFGIGPIQIIAGKADTIYTGNGGETKTEILYEGALDPQVFVDGFNESAKNRRRNAPYYYLFGPNSNTTVSVLLEDNGFAWVPKHNSPGWNSKWQSKPLSSEILKYVAFP